MTSWEGGGAPGNCLVVFFRRVAIGIFFFAESERSRTSEFKGPKLEFESFNALTQLIKLLIIIQFKNYFTTDQSI